MTPTENSPHLSAVIAKAKAYIDEAKAAAAGGLTVAEFSQLAIGLLRLVVSAIDSVPLDGVSKKQYVLSCLELLFDSVADRMVPLYLVPLWLPLRSTVKFVVLSAASGAIEQLLPLVRAAA